MKDNKFSITKGLHNALIIDDGDSSISYQISSIDSHAFKLSLSDLQEMLSNKEENIFNYNTVDVVTLILNDGTEISLHEYKGENNVKFINLKACEENGFIDTIIDKSSNFFEGYADKSWIKEQNIKKRSFNDKGCIWGSTLAETYYLQEHDFDGYDHTYNNTDIISKKRDINNYPALKYCQNIQCDLPYRAYLPACGQLQFIYNYRFLIEELQRKTYAPAVLFFGETTIWSSSEGTIDWAYCFDYGHINGHNKKWRKKILPLYKKI